MSLAHSPKIVTDGLAFYYDMANTQKSFKGAPTTNLLLFPQTITNTTYWGHANITVATSSEVAPDGTLTAAQLTATSADPYLTQTITVTAGTSYTASIYIKGSTNTIGKKGILWWWIAGTATGANTFSTAYTITGEWQRITTPVFTPTGSGTVVVRLDPADQGYTPSPATGDIYHIWGPQAEAQTFATPFVNGSRSTTQSLIDLTRNYTATVNNLGYSSNNTFTFSNGTVNVANVDLRKDWTLEAWFQTSSGNTHNLFGHGTTTINQGLHITGGAITRFGLYGNDTDFPSNPATNTWYCYTFTYQHTSPYTKQMFINGVKINGTVASGPAQYSAPAGDLRIGTTYGSGAYGYHAGLIGSAKMYNRVLSDTEVQQNFNVLKGRYGL